MHETGISRFCGGCCSTTGPGLLQLLRGSSDAGAQRGLLWGCGMGDGRSRALLLLPRGCSIGGGRSWALLLPHLLLLLNMCVICHGGRGGGALLLLQLLMPPVGRDIGRGRRAGLCACLVAGILWQWGPGERCLARPLLSTWVLRCLRLPIGPVRCSWRRGLPRVSLPLLRVRGLWGMGPSLDLLVVACSRAGGLGSMTLAVLRPILPLRDLRIWE